MAFALRIPANKVEFHKSPFSIKICFQRNTLHSSLETTFLYI